MGWEMVDPVIRETMAILHRYAGWGKVREAYEIERLRRIYMKYVERYSFIYLSLPEEAEQWVMYYQGVLDGMHRGPSGKARPPVTPLLSFDSWMDMAVSIAASRRRMTRKEANAQAEEIAYRRAQSGAAQDEPSGERLRSQRDYSGFARSATAAERLLRLHQERLRRHRDSASEEEAPASE